MKPHILLIDDSKAVQRAISTMLSSRDYTLTTASSGTEGLVCLEQQHCDLVLLDYSLPDTDGLNLLQTIVKKTPDIPVIMVTGSGSERIAVNALKSGASDYVVKSTDFVSKLPHVVRDNLDKFEMRRRNRELEEQLRDSYKQLKHLNSELEAKVQARTEELERAYQLSNELMSKAVDSNMQLAELYSEVDESRRKLDGKIRELSLLNDVGKMITSTIKVDQLLQITLDTVYRELEPQHSAILLLKEEEQWQIGVSRGTPDDLLIATKAMDGSLALFEVMKSQQPLLVQDVEAHERLQPLTKDFPGLECCMLVPLRVKDRELGMLTIYGDEDRDTFTKSDLEFVSSLASQASIAYANILLTNQRIQEEQIDMIGKMAGYLMNDLKKSLLSLRQTAERIEYDTLDADTRKDVGRKLVEGIDRMTGITLELLEFSYGQRGALTLQTVTVKEFLEQIVATFARDFDRQKITICQKLDYKGIFQIDVEKMTRAFQNIAENARQAMPDGGTFTISSRLVNEMVHFECVDEGCGISPELQSRIFEPFVSDDKSQAIGLGLTIVRKIIDEHHAHIEVRSVVAKGTTIHLSVPRVQ